MQSDGTFTLRPGYIALDSQDNLYVPATDSVFPRTAFILKREKQTGKITVFRLPDPPSNTVRAVRGIAVNNQGDLFEAEATQTTAPPIVAKGNLIKIENPSGAPITRILTQAIKSPEGIALTADGAILVADAADHKVVAFSPDGSTKTTIAGTGTAGDSGDGGQASVAQLSSPRGIRVIGQGIFICQDNLKIRSVNTSTGVINTVATGFDSRPSNIAIDLRSGFVFIASPLDHIILKTSLLFGSRSIIAGKQSQSGASGDGGPATAALLSSPNDVLVDSAGIIYIGEEGQIRVIFP
jgi:hypothetical protein